MSKHTPGPWYMDAKGSIWRRPISDLYENGGGVLGDKPLATVWKGWYGEGEQGFPVVANARLIAAAPDMLEALKSIAEFWNRDHNEKAMVGACWHAVETAEAAIAKAEGEQQ